jgi:glycosyltransferase involved in cell wall biosynthesis
MPFKPLGHPHPSGDLVIGTELYRFLRERGHDIRPISRLRTRWIYWKPWQWARLPIESARVRRAVQRLQPHIWLTYHAYYKAPDMLGVICAANRGIPYVIFQGVYSTKHRRHFKTKAGFFLNRHGLLQADAVFTNKRRDETNLRRLVPRDRLHYIAPGIRLNRLGADPRDRAALRKRWGAEDCPVILTAAMFRPGVKSDGIAQVIRSCGHMAEQGQRFQLVICGDGLRKDHLKRLARDHLGNRAYFTGHIPRAIMPRYYHSADLFVFPGIQEGLGMVYLEAQASGLPVVACRGWGASEVVRHSRTGLLSAPGDWIQFEQNMVRLLSAPELRRKMRQAAIQHMVTNHDLYHNYEKLEFILENLALPTGSRKGRAAGQV